MGKGDRRTRRGKLFRGTFGVTRPHKKKSGTAVAPAPAAKPAPKPKKAARRSKSAG
ncbi:MAG: 30S ribosomal protein THX [Chitinophagales bacterium]|nr:30S ribosomal protein THX [Chitinophagales bacterium]MDW8393026.1 30S ribosomal protein THX [Chitinophagales bacterium]